MRRKIGVDLDGTLCIGKSWRNPEDVLYAKPIPEMIEKVAELYKTDFVIIYTARQNFLISNTLEWLDKNNVKYHAICNKKIHVDYLIDDTSYNIENIGAETNL
jgi:uncharacterized HAD superfamily protein